MKNNEETIDVFWTGGLDSTFSLIRLLDANDKQVQPHYLIGRESSTGNEIDTMTRIRRALVAQSPELGSRLLPTVYTNQHLIPVFEDIKVEIEALRENGKVADQYEIMANYCRASNIDRIEVSLTSITGEKDSFEHFRKAAAFKPFVYPTIELSKVEMFRIARENKWDDILNMTSFCRRPRKKVKPCGVCGPCVDAVMSGMGYRLPLVSRIKARIQIPFRNYYRKNYLKHDKSKFFRWIKKKFEGKF
jgi:hypothetical protein